MNTVDGYRKSSYSGHSGECVEVKESPEMVFVRDTQNRELGHLAVSAREWAALMGAVCDR
ncbi:DUF397 domain-containing protein [Nocardiopsis dassonvillei]|uniref:DUF397 domain-containing protein n=1 Tax=Nocardiopsis dassonvillei TaxID=2014 RepID=UPI003672F0C7